MLHLRWSQGTTVIRIQTRQTEARSSNKGQCLLLSLLWCQIPHLSLQQEKSNQNWLRISRIITNKAINNKLSIEKLAYTVSAWGFHPWPLWVLSAWHNPVKCCPQASTQGEESNKGLEPLLSFWYQQDQHFLTSTPLHPQHCVAFWISQHLLVPIFQPCASANDQADPCRQYIFLLLFSSLASILGSHIQLPSLSLPSTCSPQPNYTFKCAR